MFDRRRFNRLAYQLRNFADGYKALGLAAAEAAGWANYGFLPDEAAAWLIEGFSLDTALPYADRYVSPVNARAMLDRVTSHA